MNVSTKLLLALVIVLGEEIFGHLLSPQTLRLIGYWSITGGCGLIFSGAIYGFVLGFSRVQANPGTHTVFVYLGAGGFMLLLIGAFALWDAYRKERKANQ